MSVKVPPKSYALKALNDAKEDLCRDKHLIPVAFIITDDEVLDFNLEFEDRKQKLSVYSKLVELAKAKNARAIITINDANVTDAPRLDNAALPNECIFMTVSGPNIQTWTVSVSYRREGSQIIFEKPVESQEDILNLLPGWMKNPIPS
jgi:hypothetical protein